MKTDVMVLSCVCAIYPPPSRLRPLTAEVFLLEEVLVSPQQDGDLQHSKAQEASHPLEKKRETPPPRWAARRVCGERSRYIPHL